MKFIVKTAWIFYLCFYTSLLFGKSYSFFAPGEVQHFYYSIMRGFEPFDTTTLVNAGQVCIDLVMLIPLYAFVLRTNIHSETFWKYCLFLKVIFDIAGNSYELNYLRAYYLDNTIYFTYVIFSIVLITAPSYVAIYQYIFHRKRLFPSS